MARYTVKNEDKDRVNPGRGGFQLPLPPSLGHIKLSGGTGGLKKAEMSETHFFWTPSEYAGAYTTGVSGCQVIAAMAWDRAGLGGKCKWFMLAHLTAMESLDADTLRAFHGYSTWVVLAQHGETLTEAQRQVLAVAVRSQVTFYNPGRSFDFGLRVQNGAWGEV